MATNDYKIAKVNPNTRPGFVDAVNGVAVSTDYALEKIYEGIKKQDYTLPPANNTTLGGVKVGKGFKTYADGSLETTVQKYELPPATANKLGGVIVGNNIDVDDSGLIRVNKNAFKTTMIDNSNLVNGSVTSDKIADQTISGANLDTSIKGTITALNSVFSGTPQALKIGSYPFGYAWISGNIAMISICNRNANAFYYDPFVVGGGIGGFDFINSEINVTHDVTFSNGIEMNISSVLSGFKSVCCTYTTYDEAASNTNTPSTISSVWLDFTGNSMKYRTNRKNASYNSARICANYFFTYKEI